MKKVLQVFIMSMIALSLCLIPAAQSVQATALPPYESSINIQNLDSVNSALISVYYYDENGTLVTLPSPYTNPVQDTIPAGSSVTYLPVHPAAGFKGSAVVTSNREIAIVSNLTVAATNRALGTFVGSSSGGSTVFFPLVDKRLNVSVFSVQNTGSGNVDIVIDFVPQPGSAYPDIANVNATIAEGAAKTYYMADYGPTQWLGAIKVTATGGTIAGVLSNVNYSNANSPLNAVYNGFSSGSGTVALPLVMEANSGNRTGTVCQNLGPGTATITMSYAPEAGYPARASDVYTNIPVNGIAAKLFNDAGTRWVGSSIVTISGGNTLACVVNQSRPTLRRSSIYEGFNPANATDTVLLPLVMSKNGSTTKTFTSVNIASADGTPVTVTCTWRPAPGYPAIAPTVKGPAPVLIFGQQSGFSPSNVAWVGSAVCTAAAGKSIVAIVNQSREFLPTGTLRDVTSAYNGFNR